MKRNIFATFALAATAMVLSAPAVLAQASNQTTIPFDFQVGKTTLPAGTYVITANSQGPVMIRSKGGKAGGVMSLSMVEYNLKPHSAQLVFHRFGKKNFLAEIWGYGEEGRTLPQSKQEREYMASDRTAETEQLVLLAMN